MNDEKNPKYERETGKKRLKRRIENEQCQGPQIEEKKRIQKDKILDEEEDEEKEEEDEYADYSKKENIEDIKI